MTHLKDAEIQKILDDFDDEHELTPDDIVDRATKN
jgi:hypothetical protein